jgi:excisionase family DNA binding protein
MGNPYDDVMRFEAAREAARIRSRRGLSLRERIEDDLEQEWYTVDEAAEELDLHPKTVRARIREGKLKASRPSPRKTRIHYTSLTSYLSKQVERDS